MKASKQCLAIFVLMIGLGCVLPNTVVFADDELNVPDYDAIVIDAPSGLRVRSAPDDNGAQIGSLWNGQKVRVTHHVEPSGWRKLLLSGGRAGYALGTYLTGPPDDDGGSTTLRDWQSVGVTARQNDSYVGIQIPRATANIWEAALYRRDIQLRSGTRYRLQFDAKAESNRTVNTWFGYLPDGSSSYKTISGHPHAISDGWKGFSHEFIAPVSVGGSQLSFQLGNSDVDVELNNVQLSTIRVTNPGGGSGGCSGASPSNRFASPVSRTISHPDYETRGYQVWLRSGPSESCDANPIYASDNMAVTELGTYAGSDQSWSLLRFTHNGSTTERWAETKFLEGGGNGGGGSGGCSEASPSNRFTTPVSRTISHPEYESRGYQVWLRSGPSEYCDANPIYASDNMAVTELGTYAGSDQSWSLLRFSHNGSTTERWAETKFLEGGGNGGGGSGGCSGASPSNLFASPVSRTISHPEFESKGYLVWLRTGPSESCDANPIYATDNMAVSELGTYAGSDQSWSLLRFTHNGATSTRWAETKFLAGGGNGGGESGGCSGASPSDRFASPVSRIISHPDYETRGYQVWLRSGPSESCDANPIYASDNMAASELGTYAGPDQSWSLLRFTHNGSTTERWAETKFLEGGGNGGGGPLPPINPPPGGVPVIIFDTDMGPDIDDALALAALHEYADQGAAHIAAVTLSRNSNTGAQYIDQVNTFYNRPDIPIGVYRNTLGGTGMDSNNRYTGSIVNQRDTYPFNVNAGGLPDGHELMRAVLEASADNSVIIIQVGFSTNTAELLNRYPDLVRRKARLLSVMAGDFVMPDGTAGRDEFNIEKHQASAQTVFSKWPNQLVVSEAGLGSGVPYPFSSIQNDFNYTSNHIIKDSYLDPQGTAGMSWHPQPNMYSWDITSVIAAIEPGLIPVVLGPGTIRVSGAKTSFNAGSGRHYVLAEGRQLSTTQHRQLTDRMVQLVSAPPRGGGSLNGRDL